MKNTPYMVAIPESGLGTYEESVSYAAKLLDEDPEQLDKKLDVLYKRNQAEAIKRVKKA